MRGPGALGARAFGALRLSAVMSALFVLLSIPVLIFILVYNYRQNAAAINATLNEVVANTKQASIENAQSMIHGVAATARVLAEVGAADPAFFRTEQSRQILFLAHLRGGDRCHLRQFRRRVSPCCDADR
jgi:adenylate cyclase